MHEPNQRHAMLFGIAAVILWSTVATAFKLSLQFMTPTQLLAWASVVSTSVLAVFVTVQRRWPEVMDTLRDRPLYYLSLGALNPCFYYLVLFRAYDLLPAQQAQALNYTWALTLSLLAVPLLRQKLTARDVVALLIGYFGAVVIATRGDLFALQFDSGAGVALALGSTVLWALYWIFNARAKSPAAVTLFLCFALGTPLVWLVMMFEGDVVMPGVHGLAGALYVGVFEMGVTFMLWLAAMRRAEHVSRIGNLIFLSPFLSLFFISAFLGEAIVPATWIGLALIVTGVVIQQHGRSAPG
ncbi:MAG TPA: DMT family transporter [Rhodocyclaceae bacterium]|nr:DMT family transporter [Rhodocyclaceae bacterium]HRQ46930.1 DMT family transporter [Rhodocyclaceae bacterium]